MQNVVERPSFHDIGRAARHRYRSQLDGVFQDVMLCGAINLPTVALECLEKLSSADHWELPRHSACLRPIGISSMAISYLVESVETVSIVGP